MILMIFLLIEIKRKGFKCFEIKVAVPSLQQGKMMTNIVQIILYMNMKNIKLKVDGTNILKSLFNSTDDITKLYDFTNRIEFYNKNLHINLILNRTETKDNINEKTVCLEILRKLLKYENNNSEESIIIFLSQYLLVVEDKEVKTLINSILQKESVPVLHQNFKHSNDLNILLNETEKLIKNHQKVPSHTMIERVDSKAPLPCRGRSETLCR
jgi:hypothetical protein